MNLINKYGSLNVEPEYNGMINEDDGRNSNIKRLTHYSLSNNCKIKISRIYGEL